MSYKVMYGVREAYFSIKNVSHLINPPSLMNWPPLTPLLLYREFSEFDERYLELPRYILFDVFSYIVLNNATIC